MCSEPNPRTATVWDACVSGGWRERDMAASLCVFTLVRQRFSWPHCLRPTYRGGLQLSLPTGVHGPTLLSVDAEEHRVLRVCSLRSEFT